MELGTWLERGYDAAFTVDGPRGPRYEVKPGIITLAQVTGRALIPASYHLSAKITVKSWDRFQIPLPFATCTFHVGQPLCVPPEMDEAERERFRLQAQQTLAALTRD